MAVSVAFFTSSRVKASVSKMTFTSVPYLWQVSHTALMSASTSAHMPLRIQP